MRSKRKLSTPDTRNDPSMTKKQKKCSETGNVEGSMSNDCKYLWDFTQPPDLILVVEGKDLHVHKYVLVNSSPVFKVMLESENFAEKNKNKIKLVGKYFNDIQEMLNFLYPFNCPITDKTNVENLLNLSREYQIDKIKDACETFLLDNASMENLIIAQEFDLTNLRNHCLTQLGSKPLADLQDHPRFLDLELTNQFALIQIQLNMLQPFVQKISQIIHASSKRDWPRNVKLTLCENCSFTAICEDCKARNMKDFVKNNKTFDWTENQS